MTTSNVTLRHDGMQRVLPMWRPPGAILTCYHTPGYGALRAPHSGLCIVRPSGPNLADLAFYCREAAAALKARNIPGPGRRTLKACLAFGILRLGKTFRLWSVLSRNGEKLAWLWCAVGALLCLTPGFSLGWTTIKRQCLVEALQFWRPRCLSLQFSFMGRERKWLIVSRFFDVPRWGSDYTAS